MNSDHSKETHAEERATSPSYRWATLPLILLAVVLGFSLQSGCVRANEHELTLEITEVIPARSHTGLIATLILKNKTNRQIVLYGFRSSEVQASMGGILSFEIIRNESDTFQCRPAKGIPKYPTAKDTIVLETGDEHAEIIDLTTYYYSKSQEDQVVWDSASNSSVRNWEPGNYRITATYSYEHKESLKHGEYLWQGSTVSAPVTMSIKR